MKAHRFLSRMINSRMIELGMLLLTLFSTLAVYFTLSEMKTQREASYLPQILLNSVEYGTEYKLYTDKKSYTYDFFNHGDVKLSLSNVGLGPAVNVEFTMEYDPELMFNKISEIAPSFTFEPIEDGIYGYHLIGFGSGNLYTSIDTITKFSALVPGAEKSYDVKIPDAYQLILRLYLEAAMLNDVPIDQLMIPPLELKMEFGDLLGKHFSKNVSIYVSAVLHSGSGSTDELRLRFMPVY